MQTTNTPLPKSRLQLEFELPPERLTRAIDQAVGRLSRQTRVPGFRPGKAPRVMLERVLGARRRPRRRRRSARRGRLPRGHDASRTSCRSTSPEVEVTQAEEGKPLIFKATVQVRPEVKLGDYENFGFKPEIKPVDETMVEQGRRRAARRPGQPRAGRGPRRPEGRLRRHRPSSAPATASPFAGGSSERMPLIIGEDRLIPGFEDNLVGAGEGRRARVRHHLPGRLPGRDRCAARGPLRGHGQGAARTRSCPTADDEFARIGRQVRRHGRAQGASCASGSRPTRSTAPATTSPTRSSTTPSANATVDLPDVLIDQEVEVMHDELRSALARQGIAEEAYLKVVEQDRGRPPHRVPAAGREAGQDAPRPLGDRQGEGRGGPGAGRRGRDRPGPVPLRGQPQPDPVELPGRCHPCSPHPGSPALPLSPGSHHLAGGGHQRPGVGRTGPERGLARAQAPAGKRPFFANLQETFQAARRLREQPFDLIIDLQGLLEERLLGSPGPGGKEAGLQPHPGVQLSGPDGAAGTLRPGGSRGFWRYLNVARHLGAPAAPPVFRLGLNPPRI